MVSAKVLKAIENDNLEEKKNTLEKLKEFLQEKIGGDTDQICDFIDEFANEHLSKASIKKKEKKIKGKKRPPSFYNHYMQKALADLKISENNKKNNDDKIPKGERMSYASKGWKEYKETPNFNDEKRAWEAKRDEEWNSMSDTDSISSKSSKGSDKEVSDKESSEKDEETDTEIEVVKKPKKEAKKPKKEAKKPKKEAKKPKKEAEKSKKEDKKSKGSKSSSDEDSDDKSDDDMDSNGKILEIINADSDDESD
tara:strand:+ start:555 stop:1313 length:759 start_codon:yes stop_codon:yes gene_type:complete